MTKVVYAADKIYRKRHMKAENTCMVPIYIYVRLEFSVYSPYICIYRDLMACAQSVANIYIYISLNLGAQG